MNKTEKILAKIEQNNADVQRLNDERERLRKELAETEVTYSIGDGFKDRDGYEYLLASTDNYKAGMVCLKTGMRLRESVGVERATAITHKEFLKIIGCHNLTRYWDSQKEVLTDDSEDLEKFEVQGLNYRDNFAASITALGQIRIHTNMHGTTNDIEKTTEIIQKLGQLKTTAKKKQNKS